MPNDFETEEVTKADDTRAFDARTAFAALRALESAGYSTHEAYRLVTRQDGFRH